MPDGQHAIIWPLLENRKDNNYLVSELIGSHSLCLRDARSGPQKHEITRHLLTKLKIFFDHQLSYFVNIDPSQRLHEAVIDKGRCFQTLIYILEIGITIEHFPDILRSEHDSLRSLIFATLISAFREFSLYPDELDPSERDILKQKLISILSAWDRDGRLTSTSIERLVLSNWLPEVLDDLQYSSQDDGRWTIREFGCASSYQAAYRLRQPPFCPDPSTAQERAESINSCKDVIRIVLGGLRETSLMKSFWELYDISWALLDVSCRGAKSRRDPSFAHTRSLTTELWETVQTLHPTAPSAVAVYNFFNDTISHLSRPGELSLPFSTIMTDLAKQGVLSAVTEFEDYLIDRDKSVQHQFRGLHMPETPNSHRNSTTRPKQQQMLVDSTAQRSINLVDPQARSKPLSAVLWQHRPNASGARDSRLTMSAMDDSSAFGPSRHSDYLDSYIAAQSAVWPPQSQDGRSTHTALSPPPSLYAPRNENRNSLTSTATSKSGYTPSVLSGDDSPQTEPPASPKSFERPNHGFPQPQPPNQELIMPILESPQPPLRALTNDSENSKGSQHSDTLKAGSIMRRVSMLNPFSRGKRASKQTPELPQGITESLPSKLPANLQFGFSATGSQLLLWDKLHFKYIISIHRSDQVGDGSIFQHGKKLTLPSWATTGRLAEAGVESGDGMVATVVHDTTSNSYKIICFDHQGKSMVGQVPEGDFAPKALAISRDDSLAAVACESKVYVYHITKDALIQYGDGLDAYSADQERANGQVQQQISFSLDSEILVVASRMPRQGREQKVTVQTRLWRCQNKRNPDPLRKPYLLTTAHPISLSAGSTDDKGISAVFCSVDAADSWAIFLAACDTSQYYSVITRKQGRSILGPEYKRIDAAAQGPGGPGVQFLFKTTNNDLYLITDLQSPNPQHIPSFRKKPSGLKMAVSLLDSGHALVFWRAGEALFLKRVNATSVNKEEEEDGGAPLRIDGLFHRLTVGE